jgi:hypothetical protein
MLKIMRKFLWAGTDMVQGGKCSVAWNMVQRLLHLGSLDIPKLMVMGMSLRLRWLWLQWCDNSIPWSELSVNTDKLSKAFFRASITYQVGNGEETILA